MKLVKVRSKRSDNSYENLHYMNIDKEEAYSIIKSLSSQLEAGNPNVGRVEFRTDKNEYFTIFVNFEGGKK